MPPKKKSNKKNDDWDAGLGETAGPIAQATADAKADEAAQDAEENEAESGGGGLLAALKKNRGKKAKKGKAVEDFVEGEDPPAPEGVDSAQGLTETIQEEINAKAPQEADLEEDDTSASSQKKLKGGKQQRGAQQVGKKEDEDEDAGDGGGLKSKKEKEKEKKEREKQRKKEQAARKKTTAPAPAPKEDKRSETTTEPASAAASATAPADGGKKKKLPPHLAALQKQQEELRRRQEEDARAKEEAKRLQEEQERLEAEEEQRKAEQRALKKQREKEKVEQLKKEGKYMTKAQEKAQKAAQARTQQLVERGGAMVAGLAGRKTTDEMPESGADGEAEAPKDSKKRPVYDRKKAAKQKQEEEKRAAEEAEQKMRELKLAQEQEDRAKAEAEKATMDAEAKKKEAEESDDEDWEAQAEKDLKDSWDADSDDEPATTKPVVNGKPVQAGADSRTAEIVESESEDSSQSDSGSSAEEEDETTTAAQREAQRRKQEAAERREKKHEEALAARSKDNLRSPICCILGHVDTGKTKLLDKIRQTNVQEGEAGGITQQIGATYFPLEAIQKKTSVVNKDNQFEFKIPGLLVIDTPGHESFTNLRSRGSSLCNIAILVVDIMHGLEPQTLESMRLLRDRKTPFIVALNKIDRLYGWSRIDNNGFQDSLAMQKKSVVSEFEKRLQETKVAFAEQGFNSELYYENKSMARNVSLVPTSAHTGEGIPDMIMLLTKLTQERMTNALMYLSEVECTVLEVKVIEGLGTTIDVVLSNGVLNEGDRIVLCGLNGAIATNIRALLTPAEMKELRVKSAYVHNKSVKASLGVKIAANDLEDAIAGSRLLVVGPDDDEDDLEEQVMSDLESLLGKVSKSGRGVSVQASTLGSLEALLEFLRVSKIPVANISIGPVYKRDVMQCGTMLEKAREYAVMLCFDVRVDKEAAAYADEVGVKIFTADIIYHLFDDFTKHTKQLAEQKKEESKLLAVFPCVLKPVAVFNKKDPIVVGVDVVEGSLKHLTPIAAVKNNPVTGVKEIIHLGRVQSIERDHKQIPVCKKGQPSVAVKIEGNNQPLYGRQLEEKDTLYSELSRQSIDVLKEFFREEVTKEEWGVVRKLKPLFDIP
ncbi:MAG: hypothetical protein Q9162_007772 [Coniocarpon cinnabarinum]